MSNIEPVTTQAVLLGVNVDHIATVREARGTVYPDPLHAAEIAQDAGADGITIHLREDRRHIRDGDVESICREIALPVNLEMAATEEMVEIARKLRPAECCIVPEKREELTTEGGLDVASQVVALTDVVAKLVDAGIQVSMFIDPEQSQIEASASIGASIVELHTGNFADAVDDTEGAMELARLSEAVAYGLEAGVQVNAGHGLHYQNVTEVASIDGITTLNIGHSIVARAVLTGLHEAVRTMKILIGQAKSGKDANLVQDPES
jgi:pyridoxine 5-phosphate synthase